MRFTPSLSALSTALLLAAPATSTSLAPWQVARLGTFSPSGRPGSSPDYYIHVNITNPDPTRSGTTAPEVAAGQVHCEFVWRYPDTPYHNVSACSVLDVASPSSSPGTNSSTSTPVVAVPWIWTVELLEATNAENPSATTDFDLLWRAAVVVSENATEDDDDDEGGEAEGVRIWQGQGHFEVGDNMQGTCAGSGFCSWGLKETSSPFPVDVGTVSCRGTVEEALQGVNCD